MALNFLSFFSDHNFAFNFYFFDILKVFFKEHPDDGFDDIRYGNLFVRTYVSQFVPIY